MSDSIVTNIAKKKIVQARAGLIPALPKTIGMAFGDGAASVVTYIALISSGCKVTSSIGCRCNSCCRDVSVARGVLTADPLAAPSPKAIPIVF